MTYAQTVQWLEKRMTSAERAYVCSANVDQLVRLRADPQFAATYRGAALVVPDGMPVVWAARLLGKPVRERVAGIDLLLGMCRLAVQHSYRCFLLGSRPWVVAAAAAALEHRFPGLRVCGREPGYFEDHAAVVARINAARPDLLFVGMGSPRQEIWLGRHFPQLTCRLALPVGGAFEVLAGRRSRAPVRLQKAGLEWAWRLAQEPRRLARRYLVDDLRFLPMVLRELCRLSGE
jgi:N-acetylglucosaminyldiphosphoundecaprenol N-acetyl-beta-D-mannosaminyltransferase